MSSATMSIHLDEGAQVRHWTMRHEVGRGSVRIELGFGNDLVLFLNRRQIAGIRDALLALDIEIERAETEAKEVAP